MRQFLARWKWHLWLALAAAAFMFLLDFLLGLSRQGVMYPDSYGYLVSAKNLYVFHRGHNYRPMLLAAIQGFPYLFGASDGFIVAFSRFLNGVCWIASVLLLFETLKMVTPFRVAFRVALASVFLLGLPVMGFHLLSENVFVLFTTLGIYLVFRYFRDKKPLFMYGFVSVFLLSMLIRPGAKFFGILIALYFCRELWKMRVSRWRYLVIGSVFLVLVQCAGLLYQFGNFTISYVDANAYYNYLGSRAAGVPIDARDSQGKSPRWQYMATLTNPQQKVAAAEDFKYQLTHNFGGFVSAYFVNLTGNATSGNLVLSDSKNVDASPWFAPAKKILEAVALWQNRVLSVLSLVFSVLFLFRRSALQIVSVLILYTILLSAVSCSQGDRFHIVIFPFVLLLIAVFFFPTDKKRAIG